MPRLFCTFCEHEWDDGLDSIWSCPKCEIGAARTAVVSCTIEELRSAIARLNAPVPPRRASFADVFYSTYGVPRTVDYDLLAVLFDTVHVSEGWMAETAAADDERLHAYVSADVIKPTMLDSFIEIHPPLLDEFKARWRGTTFGERIDFRQTLGGATAAWYVNNLAEVLSSFDFSIVPHARAWTYFRDLVGDELAGQFFPHAIDHLHTRLNGHGLVASTLGLSMIADETMSAVWRTKMISRWQHAGLSRTALEAATQWYCRTTAEVGSGLPVDTVLRFRRDDDARNRFLEFLRRQPPDSTRELSTYREHLASRLDAALRAYNRACGRGRDVRKAALSGLLATLGNLLGGPVGAAVGGIGASLVTFFADDASHRAVEPWACYFAEWREAKK